MLRMDRGVRDLSSAGAQGTVTRQRWCRGHVAAANYTATKGPSNRGGLHSGDLHVP
jgi:hypothetical protein